MTAADVTRDVLVATACLLAAYDVVVCRLYGSEATISAVLADDCHRHPIIAAILGGLLCHVLWPVFTRYPRDLP